MKEATGKYLRFLDSDDWLTNLDKLMHKLKDCEADLVFTDHSTFYVDKGTSKIDKCDGPVNMILPITNLPIERFINQHYYASFQRVTCKTKILSPFYPIFTEKTRYDDSIMSILPISLGNTYIVLDFVLYNYLIGRDGQTVEKANLMRYCEQHNAEYGKIYDFAVKYTKEDMRLLINALLFRAFTDTITIAIELPFVRRKYCISYLKKKVPLSMMYKFNKRIMRYLSWPFFFAYLYDMIRDIKHKILS